MQYINQNKKIMKQLEKIIGNVKIISHDKSHSIIEAVPESGIVQHNELLLLLSSFDTVDIEYSARHGFVISIQDTYYF